MNTDASVMVPVEPVQTMLDKAHATLPPGLRHIGFDQLRKIYAAMLAAAPAQAAEEGNLMREYTALRWGLIRIATGKDPLPAQRIADEAIAANRSFDDSLNTDTRPSSDGLSAGEVVTDAMRQAGVDASPLYPLAGKGKRVGVTDADAEAIYLAMRALAPTGPALSAGEREALDVLEIVHKDCLAFGVGNVRAVCAALRRLSGAVSVDEGMVERACDAYAYAQFDAIGYHGDEVVSAYMRAALTAALQAKAP